MPIRRNNSPNRESPLIASQTGSSGRNITGVQGDVANPADLVRFYNAVQKTDRKIDVIFANAGIAQLGAFGAAEEEFFDLHFDADVRRLFFTVQKGLPFMNEGGAIILTGSIAGIKGFPGMSVYSATKAAVRSFARAWTNELRERRIISKRQSSSDLSSRRRITCAICTSRSAAPWTGSTTNRNTGCRRLRARRHAASTKPLERL